MMQGQYIMLQQLFKIHDETMSCGLCDDYTVHSHMYSNSAVHLIIKFYSENDYLYNLKCGAYMIVMFAHV